MKKAIDVTRTDMSSIRSGRATPSLVEHITISAYEGTQKLTLMEMATITTQDAKTILVQPYDPSQLKSIEKGISEAKTGLNPVVDGDVIRISIPSLSQERRIEYIKLAKTKLEGGKIMVRQVRAEAMKDVKKLDGDKQITEDERKHTEKRIQELTDEMIEELDTLGQAKEKELMEI